MRRNRRVKVVATLGPASSATEMIERLFLAGVDVFRINMSHSSHETARALQNSVRWVASATATRSASSADLQGPKFRVGDFHGGRVFVNDGSIFRFERDEKPGTQRQRATCRTRRSFAAVAPGHMLLLDDGKIRMRVIENTANTIAAEVLVGGALAQPQGHQPARHASARRPAHDQGPHRSRAPLEDRRRLDRAVVPAARSRRARRAQARRRSRGDPRQDREAVGHHRSRRHHRRLRRDHGRARRPRRGDPGRARAGPAEEDHAQGARRRQAGGGRDADARKHDLLARADARRGVRRRDRRVRRRGRGDAVGRIRDRAVPAGGDPDGRPHRHRGGGATRATTPSCTRRRRRRSRPAPTPSPPLRTPSPTRSSSRPSSATRRPARPHCA